jgi:hypothetical protein
MSLYFSHGGLTGRLPCPPADQWYDVLDEDLRIPMIGLKKKELPPWFKQLEQYAKVLLVLFVAKDGGAYDVIETLRGQVRREALDGNHANVTHRSGVRRSGEIGIEHRRGDWIFTA